jgi:hypothetical protein
VLHQDVVLDSTSSPSGLHEFAFLSVLFQCRLSVADIHI